MDEVKLEYKNPFSKGQRKVASSIKEILIHSKQAADLMIQHLLDTGVIEEEKHNTLYCWCCRFTDMLRHEVWIIFRALPRKMPGFIFWTTFAGCP